MSDLTPARDAKAIYAEYDAATETLQALRATNHFAYLAWSAEQRLSYDQMMRAAEARWIRAFDAWMTLVEGGFYQ